MAMILTDKSSIPKYQKIRAQLESSMKTGIYHKDAKLPSQNELAKQFDVSLLTVRHALGILEDDGLISRERGRGTFIRKQSAVKTEKANIALIFTEMCKSNSSYQRTELQVLERMLSERNKHLVLATLTSKDIVQGKIPPILESQTVDGVLLENFVQDIHVDFLKNRGFPLVVIGSHDIEREQAQVVYDQGQASYLMSRALLEFEKGKLYFITEPFKYHYTYELADGYSRACREYGQDENIKIVINENEDPYSEVLRIVKEESGPFSLLVHADIAHAIADIFKEYELHLENHPVAIYGAADYVPPYVRSEFNHCTLDIHKGTEVAVETLNRVIDGKSVGRVVLEPELRTTVENGLLRMKLTWNKPMERR